MIKFLSKEQIDQAIKDESLYLYMAGSGDCKVLELLSYQYRYITMMTETHGEITIENRDNNSSYLFIK